MPLVNEVVIGLKDKDAFNSSSPSGDGQFLGYVQNPSLASILDILFDQASRRPSAVVRTSSRRSSRASPA